MPFNCKQLALAGAVFDLRIDSRLVLNSPNESSISQVIPEAGKTKFVSGTWDSKLVPGLSMGQEMEGVWTEVPKTNYSCFHKTNLHSLLQSAGITDVYIAGLHTDTSIFATALDAFQAGFATHVVRDAVATVRGPQQNLQALQNLTINFGSSVLVTKDEVLALAGKN